MSDHTQPPTEPGPATTGYASPESVATGDSSGAAAPPEPAGQYQRFCRHCSTQTTTQADTCPVCGASYLHESWFTKQRLIALAAVAGLVVLIGGGVMVVRARQAQQAEQDRIAAQQAADAARAQQEAAAQAAREQQAQEAAEKAKVQVSLRKLQVPGIEKSVTKMAQGHARQGMLDGWPKATKCSPAAGQSIENLNKTTTKFSCFVITERLGGGQARGFYYHALMNWDSGRYTYGYGEN